MAPKDIALGSVIVVGGCGLLGHHIVKYLLENGSSPSNITVFDISTRTNRYADVRYIAGDLAHKSDLSAALDIAKPNVVVNVASPFALTPNKSVFWRCNVIGVQNIIQLAQEKGIRVLVHTSSLEVIQDSFRDLTFATEDWPVLDNPADGSPYAKSKALGEVLVTSASGEKGLLTVAFRIPTMFGEDESDKSLIQQFIHFGRSGQTKFQIGSNKNLVDWCYAGNVAEGHVLAAKILLQTAQSPTSISQTDRIDGQVINLSNDDPWFFWDFARTVAAIAGYPTNEKGIWVINVEVVCFFAAIWEWIYWLVTFGGSPAFTTRTFRYTAHSRTLNIAKARQKLGYEPRVSMKDGIKKSVEFHLDRERKGKEK